MHNLEENSVQSIEFEAPLSADGSSAPPGKHFSIDLSMELERQLDMESESYPPTPPYITDPHIEQNDDHPTARESLDPQVLAHIIKQLRESLLEVTKDRDQLLQMVAFSTTHEAELQEALQLMTDKATMMEVELSDARKKIHDDEDSISMLRTKVEESRRGLMRLQTEGRRQSIAPDLSRATITSLGGSQPSKRASFVPLAGRASSHRRISSVSDSGLIDLSSNSNSNSPSLVPPGGTSARRHSSIYGRMSPSQLDIGEDILSVEVDGLRREVQTLKEDLENTKHELQESNEAREASEMCAKALREFIEENNVGLPEASGLNTLKLPTPPTLARGHEEDESKKAGDSGTSWGFKLWKDATLRRPTISQSASPAPEPLPQTPASITPLSRKIGGFFSSRSNSFSIGSNTSQVDSATPQLQTNAARNVRDSVHSFSDASSVTEPISPPAELNDPHLVVVRDVTNLSDLGSTRSSPSALVEGKEVRADDDMPFTHPGVVS